MTVLNRINWADTSKNFYFLIMKEKDKKIIKDAERKVSIILKSISISLIAIVLICGYLMFLYFVSTAYVYTIILLFVLVVFGIIKRHIRAE